jgi:hypothetical protein
MASRSGYSNSNTKVQRPIFDKNSKMKRYEIIYDEDISSLRAGFMRFLTYVPNLNEDTLWEVKPGFEYRTDLISKKFYGTTIFDWVIEQINDVRDPIKDVFIGRKLVIPTKENIYTVI